jgi:hypothetical protein
MYQGEKDYKGSNITVSFERDEIKKWNILFIKAEQIKG